MGNGTNAHGTAHTRDTHLLSFGPWKKWNITVVRNFPTKSSIQRLLGSTRFGRAKSAVRVGSPVMPPCRRDCIWKALLFARTPLRSLPSRPAESEKSSRLPQHTRFT